MNHFQPPFIVFNFSSQRFTDNGKLRTDNGDLLILNLTNRKQFWMKKSSIQNQILAKLEQDLGDLLMPMVHPRFPVKSMPRGIKIGKQEIEMNYYIEYPDLHFGKKVTLSSFNLKLLNIANSLVLPIDISVKYA